MNSGNNLKYRNNYEFYEDMVSIFINYGEYY